MHRNCHAIGDTNLFNDQVGKIGEYRHGLIYWIEKGGS